MRPSERRELVAEVRIFLYKYNCIRFFSVIYFLKKIFLIGHRVNGTFNVPFAGALRGTSSEYFLFSLL